MTEAQCQALRDRFPDAATKVSRLDPEGDIDDPSGLGPEAFLVLGRRLQKLVQQRLFEITVGHHVAVA
jgi:hypothetical protein